MKIEGDSEVGAGIPPWVEDRATVERLAEEMNNSTQANDTKWRALVEFRAAEWQRVSGVFGLDQIPIAEARRAMSRSGATPQCPPALSPVESWEKWSWVETARVLQASSRGNARGQGGERETTSLSLKALAIATIWRTRARQRQLMRGVFSLLLKFWPPAPALPSQQEGTAPQSQESDRK